MVKTFNGLDNEFALSTGSNVNSSPGRSKFDYPPTSSTNLTVTSQEGDTDPNLFEVGETYTVSWSVASSGTILDATVIRSDDAPSGGGGVIVFEGLDENGNLAQVVWTPSFDLETWYFDNFNGGCHPNFTPRTKTRPIPMPMCVSPWVSPSARHMARNRSKRCLLVITFQRGIMDAGKSFGRGAKPWSGPGGMRRSVLIRAQLATVGLCACRNSIA